jgi:hypothetical protein
LHMPLRYLPRSTLAAVYPGLIFIPKKVTTEFGSLDLIRCSPLWVSLQMLKPGRSQSPADLITDNRLRAKRCSQSLRGKLKLPATV